MKCYWGLEDRRPWICSGGKFMKTITAEYRTAPSERIDLDKDISG